MLAEYAVIIFRRGLDDVIVRLASRDLALPVLSECHDNKLLR